MRMLLWIGKRFDSRRYRYVMYILLACNLALGVAGVMTLVTSQSVLAITAISSAQIVVLVFQVLLLVSVIRVQRENK